eukprot:1091396-Prymnesium_polylepis.1
MRHRRRDGRRPHADAWRGAARAGALGRWHAHAEPRDGGGERHFWPGVGQQLRERAHLLGRARRAHA